MSILEDLQASREDQITMTTLKWDYEGPFTIDIEATQDDVDELGHVNNSVYLTWIEKVAWAQSVSAGVSAKDYQRLGLGMAAIDTSIQYLSSCYAQDKLRVANWIVENDQRIRAVRHYQIIRLQDEVTVARAKTTFACVNLKTGKPARMPQEFKEAYAVYPCF